MELPVNYKENMKALLGEDYDAFIRSYENKPYSGIRINTSKIDCNTFEQLAPYSIEKIPYIPNGYFINDEDGWSKHPYYFAGLYYIQEPSAMLPAMILPVDKDDMVCDLCAAPGGKSTELACQTDNVVLSNDISRSRALPLVKNMELFGRDNYMITCTSPEELSVRLPQTFDKILVDAPCSGEGMFRKDRGLVRSYMNKGPKQYCGLQNSILECAYKMVRPGGSILYSTCTFSDIEDEQVIQKFLSHHTDMSLVDIDRTDGLCGPYHKYSDSSSLAGCVHAFPHRFKGEGHFAALIRKSGDSISIAKKGKLFCGFDKVRDVLSGFTVHFSKEYMRRFSNKRFLFSDDGNIYMIPEGADAVYDKSIRYLRTGVCVGRVGKGGHFTPHTAFALSLKYNDFNNCLNYTAHDPEVIKYIKGETLVIDEDSHVQCTKGYVLVCVDTYPLGFAYSDGYKLKNLYEKGWVYR